MEFACSRCRRIIRTARFSYVIHLVYVSSLPGPDELLCAYLMTHPQSLYNGGTLQDFLGKGEYLIASREYFLLTNTH